MVLLAAISAVLGQMRQDAGYAFTVVKNRQPVLGPLLFKVENICLVIADVTKKFLLRRANFVLPPAPHCLQADFPSGGDLLLSHYGIVHLGLLGKFTMTTLFAAEANRYVQNRSVSSRSDKASRILEQ